MAIALEDAIRKREDAEAEILGILSRLEGETMRSIRSVRTDHLSIAQLINLDDASTLVRVRIEIHL